jgi:hypothetical protein
MILHLISAGFHSRKLHGKWGTADFFDSKPISAGLTLRIRSKSVNPAESDMILLYFCDGSLARDLRGGVPVLSPDMRKGALSCSFSCLAEDGGLSFQEPLV